MQITFNTAARDCLTEETNADHWPSNRSGSTHPDSDRGASHRTVSRSGACGIGGRPAARASPREEQFRPMTRPTSSPSPIQSRLGDDVVTPVWHTLVWGIRALGFWLAIALPFCYLPLLVAGFTGPNHGLAFGTLLVLHVVALVVGHEHHR